MSYAEESFIIQCGRKITAKELDVIRETVGLFGRLSRRELAQTICEHLGWFTASGTYKADACLKLLKKLESQGDMRIPAKRIQSQRQSGGNIGCTSRTDPQPDIMGTLMDLGSVSLEIVDGKEARGLWNEYMSRYHYLGYKRPFGYYLRYFITSEKGVLGCILFAGAAKALGVRDQWIGWRQQQRLRNLAWVINNTRLLIFPWVQVRYLASHVLGQLARRIRDDWYGRWGYHPVLMETFVDPARFKGVCYRAAGWIYLGKTTGEGLCRAGRHYSTTVKMIYVLPLVKDFRSKLCSEALVGRVQE